MAVIGSFAEASASRRTFTVQSAMRHQLPRRERVGPGQPRNLDRGNRTQVTRSAAVRLLAQFRVAAEEEELAGEQLRLRVRVPEEGDRRERRLPVGREHLSRDGQVLGRAGRGAGREGVVRDDVGPGGPFEPGERGLPVVAPEVLVGANRDDFLVLVDADDAVESVLLAEPGIPRLVQQLLQGVPLGFRHVEAVELGGSPVGVAHQPGVGQATDSGLAMRGSRNMVRGQESGVRSQGSFVLLTPDP